MTDVYEQITRNEGNRLKPYLDCCGKSWRDCTCAKKGILTIGRGRNLDDRGISAKESWELFQNDVEDAKQEINEKFPWAAGRLNDPRYAVLVDMCHNVGIGGLLGFQNMLAAIKAEDWQRAHDELLDSLYANQVGKRAEKNAKQLLTGSWQV